MKLLLTGLIIASTANAGTIVPNIQWNKVVQNETGAATALGARNNASLYLSSSTTEPDEGDDTTTSLIGAQVFKSFDKIAIEALALRYNDDDDDEGKIFLGRAGYSFDGGLSFGARLSHSSFDDFESNTIGISGSKILNNGIVFGGGLTTRTSGSEAPNRETIFGGVGYLNENVTAAEAIIRYTPQDNHKEGGVTYIRDEQTIIDLNGTHTMGKFQLSGSIEFVFEKNDDSDADTDTESASSDLSAGGEFKINEMFAVGALIGFSKEEEVDNDNSDNDETLTTNSIAVTGRFNISQFQVFAQLTTATEDIEYGDDTDDEQEVSQSATVLGTYFF